MLGHYLEKDMRDPSRSFVPVDDDFKGIKEGNTVEVVFENEGHQMEKLPVKVTRASTEVEPYSFSGIISSKPQVLVSPLQNEEVHFGTAHISNIYPTS